MWAHTIYEFCLCVPFLNAASRRWFFHRDQWWCLCYVSMEKMHSKQRIVLYEALERSSDTSQTMLQRISGKTFFRGQNYNRIIVNCEFDSTWSAIVRDAYFLRLIFSIEYFYLIFLIDFISWSITLRTQNHHNSMEYESVRMGFREGSLPKDRAYILGTKDTVVANRSDKINQKSVASKIN